MPYVKTNWLDRIVQFPRRFIKSNETSTSVTLERDPGIVTAAGTPLNATNLNKMEQGIADAVALGEAALPKSGGISTGNQILDVNGSVANSWSYTQRFGYRDSSNVRREAYLQANNKGEPYWNSNLPGGAGTLWSTTNLRWNAGRLEYNDGGTWKPVGAIGTTVKGSYSAPVGGTNGNGTKATILNVAGAGTLLYMLAAGAGTVEILIDGTVIASAGNISSHILMPSGTILTTSTEYGNGMVRFDFKNSLQIRFTTSSEGPTIQWTYTAY